MNKRLIIKIIFIVLIIILEIVCLIKIYQNKYNRNINIIEKNIIINEENAEISQLTEEWLIEMPDHPIEKYVQTTLNFRQTPNINSNIINILNINDKIIQLKEWDNNWSKVKVNDDIGFVYTKYLADTQIVIEKPRIETEYSDNNVIEYSGNSLTSLGNYVLTAYCGCVKCNEGYRNNITASGATARANHTIAAPSNIPFGTKILINGREYVVEDRGGTIKGNRIDIFFNYHSEALDFGRQTAEIFIIN